MSEISYLNAGDSAVIVEFGNEISKDINTQIRNLTYALAPMERRGALEQEDSDICHTHGKCRSGDFIDGIVEIIPTYRSIAIVFDPMAITRAEVIEAVERICDSARTIPDIPVRIIEIPVCYGGKYGEDMCTVSRHTGLSETEIVSRHSGVDYLVYMLGFAPGFAYLGGMDEKLATPRLASPRLRIEAGSVGIAGNQTGFYPIPSPGGWQIIGRTPLKLYDPAAQPPVFVKAGDYIRFVSIGESEFQEIQTMVEKGKYIVRTYAGEIQNGQERSSAGV